MKKQIILTLLITIIIINTPFISEYFRVVNTIIHESGHAIIALILNGQVYSMSLFSNTEGVTEIGSNSVIASIISSLAGYIVSSLAVIAVALLWKKGMHKTILILFLSLTIIDLVLWIRNGYGFIWCVIFILLLLSFLKWANSKILSYFTLFILSIIFIDSISASFDILILSFTDNLKAGDATNLQKATTIPATVWGSFFILQTIVLNAIALKIFISKRKVQIQKENTTV